MIRAELRRLQRRDGDSFRRARASVDGRAPAGRAASDTPADRPRESGKDYEPRPQEDLARRRIAYHLIALLTVMIFSLLAMVTFGVIEVGDVDKFGVIVAPIVTLVSAATSSYFAARRAK